MKFGFTLPNFDISSDPRTAVEIAQLIEETGWDGFFLWDHALWTWPHNMPTADPYMLLAAIAAHTSRIKVGALITPVPRRRPGTLARQLTTLDHLSGGRAIAGVGIGGDWFGDYSKFGEPADQKAHGDMLDEGLQVITGLWSGEPFSFDGKHFKIDDVQFLPKPVQEPRIPVWVAGTWPNKKPFRRAAQWDGVYPLHKDDRPMQPQDIKDMLEYMMPFRQSDAPFDVLAGGTTGEDPQKDRDHIAGMEEAGATWWIEGPWPPSALDDIKKKIEQGPPGK